MVCGEEFGAGGYRSIHHIGEHPVYTKAVKLLVLGEGATVGVGIR